MHKDWYELQSDYEEVQNMPINPTNIKKFPEGYIFDENKSVLWNKEELKKRNNEYTEEKTRLLRNKSEALLSVHNDIITEISNETGLDFAKSSKIWNYVFEKWHGFGLYDTFSNLQEIIILISDIINK